MILRAILSGTTKWMLVGPDTPMKFAQVKSVDKNVFGAPYLQNNYGAFKLFLFLILQ